MSSVHAPRRGRPRIHGDEAILEAALRMFAVYGYEGTSLRSLNRFLGLSHAAISQRFGSKEQLYLAAIDHGFGSMLAELRQIVRSTPMPEDPLEELRLRFRAFIVASSRWPLLNRLMNNEGVHPSPHLDHIFDTYVEPAMRVSRRLRARLVAEGVLAPHTDRAVFVLLAHGASSGFGLRGIAARFDRVDGPLDTDAYADELATMLVNALRPTHC